MPGSIIEAEATAPRHLDCRSGRLLGAGHDRFEGAYGDGVDVAASTSRACGWAPCCDGRPTLSRCIDVPYPPGGPPARACIRRDWG
jgi:hypothetical protein